MDIEEIKKGIAAYHREQRCLLKLIRLTGGLTASRFDELFRGREYRTKKLKMHQITGDTFLLGAGQNGFNEWAEQLDLLQYMMRVGLVDTTRNEDNEIVYIIDKSSCTTRFPA